ncbi:MAG: HAD family hydrolase [Alphaproteobacteria bacterium]|nr:HAD family hydrolase [Alphaproteobacteria bacterium]
MTSLHWLPEVKDWRERLRALSADSERAWTNAVGLANARLDFVRTNGLDEALRRTIGADPPGGLAARPVRLAILGSSTFAHLHPSLRIAGVRRNMHVTVYENDYGQYWQELFDVGSALHAFKPTVVLLALDAQHLAAGVSAAMDADAVAAELQDVTERVRACWQMIRDAFGCQILFQMPLPVHPPLLGANEHRLPGSHAAFIARLGEALRPMADAAGVDLLALDARAALDGLAAWHDPALWHRAKQEVSPAAAPMYGELVLRLIAARLGRSAKCLVLDLDNTLWGGVIGDDGLDGIVLGQGSALGEAYAAFQAYARELARRGVILAVCSKNDEAVALEAFERHPEMVLRRADIASFVANWSDKAGNIRAIAQELNIGLDALVFIDDNPFERTLVRQELPMVAVPEVTDDPAGFARTLADAGYFETLWVTDDDRARTVQYQGNRAREALRTSATDLPTYLRGLEMQLRWRRFDATGLQRVVQLINKTNQFNLTTRRYTEAEVQDLMQDPRAFGLQLRLIDRFGDNGIIAILIGRLGADGDLAIDTWLMSCRVLGRQVEPASLNLIAAEARRLGAARLVGAYVPTAKNGMVKDHYAKLGFTEIARAADGASKSVLDLAAFAPIETFIDVAEG